MKIIYLLSFLLLFIIDGEKATAQSRNSTNGTRISISSFNEDSINSFDNVYVKDSLIEPLAATPAWFELRLFFPNVEDANRSQFWVVRCLGDTVSLYKFLFWYTSWKEPTVFAGFTTVKAVCVFTDTMYARRKIISLNRKLSADSVVRGLMGLNFFTVADQSHLLDTLKSYGVQIADPCNGATECSYRDLLYIQIKANQKFRNFFLLAHDFTPFYPSNEAFKTGNLIVRKLWELFGVR